MTQPTPDLEGRLYTKEHEWVAVGPDGVATIGITHFAQEQLGAVVYLGLPEPGTELKQFGKFGEAESVKAVSEIFCPVSGLVTAVNQDLTKQPELVNNEPYGNGWLVKVSGINPNELTGLMKPSEYQAYIAQAGQAHH